MKIIVNADDMGYTKGVSDGILDGHLKGIVSSTTVMCHMPGAAYAAEILKSAPDLGVGVHLTLTCGSPLTHVPSLIRPDGTFLKNKEFYSSYVSPEEVYQEFEAQIEKFIELFHRLPTHMDSHQGCYDSVSLTVMQPGAVSQNHNTAEILAQAKKLSEKYGLPMRRNCAYRWLHEYHAERGNAESMIELLTQYQDEEALEFMVHPGYCDLELYQNSSYNFDRVKELAGLTDPRLKEYLTQHHIQLTHF